MELSRLKVALATLLLSSCVSKTPPAATPPMAAVHLHNLSQEEANIGSYDKLRSMALAILEQGYRSEDSEEQLLAIYGAGISSHEKMTYILERGLRSSNVQVQLAALHFLSQVQSDYADALINRSLGSRHLITRLEAAYHLAKKKTPSASGQINALMHKVTPSVRPLFPQLFALEGSPRSLTILRKLLLDSDDDVSSETLVHIAQYQHAEILPQIREIYHCFNIFQQEAYAWAIGTLKDESSKQQLYALSQMPANNIKIAAALSLSHLGDENAYKDILQLAQQHDLFAISTLEEFEQAAPLLQTLTQDLNIQVRFNAALSLLKQHNPACTAVIEDILTLPADNFVLIPTFSPGKSIVAFRVHTFTDNNIQLPPFSQEISFNIRLKILQECINLPEDDFLNIAEALLDKRQNDLVPTLIHLLENLDSPQSIQLLQKHSSQPGAPLIRDYCTLALYRMTKEPYYEEKVQEWLQKQRHQDLLQFHALVPWGSHHQSSPYELTATESSQILIETLETMAQGQSERGVKEILSALAHGNPKNRYILAGLLLRAIE